MASEPIKVYLRFRPLSSQEFEQNDDIMWNLNKNSVSIQAEDLNLFINDKKISSNYNPSFQFDYCFSWDSNNQEIYTKVAKNQVLSALDGYNATIFAYGQTGSGKTYTMLGKQEDNQVLASRNMNIEYSDKTLEKTVENRSENYEGIIVLALEDIFSVVKGCSDRKFYFSCSYMEIYNEHVYDLLKPPEEFTNEILDVVEGPGKEFVVRGLSEQVVSSINEVLESLYKGEQNRHYAATNLNHHSSRSHTIFKLNVKSLSVIPKTGDCEESDKYENITTESAINFVDLAGSEKIKTLQAAAEMEKFKNSQFSALSYKSDIDRIMAEGKNINTSLFYLCQVINKLSEKKLGIIKSDSHIPFRNSNLTKILRSSLAGNSRTCIICTATAARSQFEQTLSTLRFGNSARSITNKVRANIKTETNTQLLLTYEQDIASLKRELELTYQRGKAYSSETLVIRQQLESKIANMSKKILKKNIINVIRMVKVKEVKELHCPKAGNLFSSNVSEASKKYMTWENEKFTDKGYSVYKELQVVDREKKNLLNNIVNINNSMNCLAVANQSLAKEREKYEEIIEKAVVEKENLEREYVKIESEKSGLEKTTKLFECPEAAEDLNDEALETFECLLLKRISDIKEERAKRKYESMYKAFLSKVEAFV